MARTWLINSRGIAKKIKNATRFSNYQVRDLGTDAKRECPNCNYLIDNHDVSLEWPGLPAGVKFDPTDVELIEHLEGKVGIDSSHPHIFIDEFIPTLEMEQGICYTHPENLPGVKKDGSTVHFFHRTSNAYATGHRKRRKINNECSISEERVRWHKTGKTKPVLVDGVQKGWKKIMVLYRISKKGSKPDKANWVMHQYHLGTGEEENDGELVVSKIFYHLAKQMDTGDMDLPIEESGQWTVRAGPRTPKTNTPQPPRPKKNLPHEDDKDNTPVLTVQEQNVDDQESLCNIVHLKDENINPPWWAGESQAVEEPNHNDIEESLLCHEVLDSFPPINPPWWAGESQAVEEPNHNEIEESLLCHEVLDSFPPIDEPSIYFNHHIFAHGRNEGDEGNASTVFGFSDLDNIELDTPPDFQLADLQFGSQESIKGWLDRL